jgi:preprotein translocase SecE subunit
MAERGHDEPENELAETSGAAPRMARYGEGQEGRPARKERSHAGPNDNFFARTAKFVRDIRGELGRVAWPTALQVRNTTVITVVAVIFFAIYLYVVDRGFAFVIDQIQKLLGGAA